MTDSDPSDDPIMDAVKKKRQNGVPVEALEDLVQEWREQASEGTGEIGSSTYLKTRATYYRRCADELEALITDYNE